MNTPSRPRATKIICTIGPATDTSDMLGQLIEAGANVFRLNMSHSKHDWVREVVFRIRRKAAELEANVAILFDLQGPSIRTGDLAEPYHLKKGDTVEIRLGTAKPELPFSTTVNYDGLLQDVQAGHTMVVDNGGILMRIAEVRPDRLICDVLTEGVFGSRRHINLPGVALRLPALTEKDLADLAVAVECETDYVDAPPHGICAPSPSTVSLFSLGLFLSSIKLAEVKHVYKNSFTPFVLLAVGTGFLLCIIDYLSICQNNPEWNMHKILASYGVWNISWPAVHLNSLCPVFGALLLMALGIWLEKKIPAARKLSNYAPACFLIFVLHYPLIMLIPSHIWKQSFFAPFVLIPAIIFLIVAFYLFLRKFFPACLPYVANDRITHVPKKN